MKKPVTATRIVSIIFFGLLMAVIASCSSTDDSTNAGGVTGDNTGSPNTDTTAGTGSVALLLTDAPSDIFEEVNITVVKAELLSDEGRVTLFEGEQVYNLLDLTDATIFTVRDGIAAGTYSKIRLTLSDIELVDYNDTDTTDDDIIYHPRLPGNGKLDLNPKGSFDVTAGATLTVQLDIDASKSISIVKKGNKDEFNFRPVVFIDIVTDVFAERYIKLHGDIKNIDSDRSTFQLCNTDIPVLTDEDDTDSSSGCINVTTDDSSAIFDINGMPAAFVDLSDGEEATVFGLLQRDDDGSEGDAGDSGSDSDGDSEGDSDDSSGSATESDDDTDEAKESDDARELDDLVLKAALIELGPEAGFQKLNGETTTAVDADDQFDMNVDAGQGFTTPFILKVQIQDGTRLIRRDGTPVDSADLASGTDVTVRGVIDAITNTMFVSLIIVDSDSTDPLAGTVGDNPDNSCGFSLMTDTGDRSVKTDSSTEIFLVTSTAEESSSSPIDVTELSAGQQVDVFGHEDSGCFEADIIIAY